MKDEKTRGYTDEATNLFISTHCTAVRRNGTPCPKKVETVGVDDYCTGHINGAFDLETAIPCSAQRLDGRDCRDFTIGAGHDYCETHEQMEADGRL